jgi:starch synthase (maltosyl-transferring)
MPGRARPRSGTHTVGAARNARAGPGLRGRPSGYPATHVSTGPPRTPPSRIRIADVAPAIGGGRAPVKRTLGERVEISCTLVRDGHEVLRAAAEVVSPDGAVTELPLQPDGPDLWRATITAGTLGLHRFRVAAWVDHFASWREELSRKVAAGRRDLESELAEGAAVADRLADDLADGDRERAHALARELRGGGPAGARAAAALAEDLPEVMARVGRRPELTRSDDFELDVDRERARVGTWYELFPRSFGGLRGVAEQLPRLAALGVDVVYLPPIHPIGITHRKGRNNAPEAAPGDPGSPWAIGGRGGGHTAVDPGIGDLADLEALAAEGRRHGVEIALDFAIQCSPDHPWLTEHPEWFHRRPDGTLKYAENPPKRYQDIYNVNWDSPDWRGLWRELRGVVLFWIARGVQIFRVDNPHTKPLPFWRWLIRSVRERHPEVIFLSEAFTSPARMYALAEAGFSQSYTYFTWKNSAAELSDYMRELASAPVSDVFRPNFFVNTPDILHAYLQDGGRPAFVARLVLAATLSPSYGIYSGFENLERTPVAPGSEEYLDSEKYELKRRALDGELLPLFARLNEIRRGEAPLRRIDLRLLPAGNDALMAYAKGRGAGTIITCVNTDPHRAREGLVEVPWDLDIPGQFRVRDLLSGAAHDWHQGGNYVLLDPSLPAHVLRVEF